MLNKKGKGGRAPGGIDTVVWPDTATEQTLKERLVTDIGINEIIKK